MDKLCSHLLQDTDDRAVREIRLETQTVAEHLSSTETALRSVPALYITNQTNRTKKV